MFRCQAPCLEHRNTTQDRIVFSTFLQGTRMYSSLPDADAYAQMILDDSQFCNELLWTDCHSYLDLDAPTSLEGLGLTENQFVEQFNALLVEQFNTHLGVVIAPNDILWSTSTREGKLSYHLKITSSQYYWPVESRATMKQFFKLVAQETYNTPFHYYRHDDSQLTPTSVVDGAVYSANRCMRSLGCRKMDHDTIFTTLDNRVTHSLIVNHMLTISDTTGMQPFVLKTKPKNSVSRSISTSILNSLAASYDSEYVTTRGSLVVLRNVGCRICPIGQESNETDNAFFVLRGSTVYFGCHNQECQGKTIKVHEFASKKQFSYYQDYMKLVNKREPEISDVCEYLSDVVSYVDRPSEPFFVTKSKIGLSCFDHRVSVDQVNFAKNLFRGYSDIHLPHDEEPIRFSKILGMLLKQRKIPTYSDIVWEPHLGSDVPSVPQNKLNTFTGFALENLQDSDIDFEQTQIYDLLTRLCGHQQGCIKYLCSFIAHKLQKPAQKHPIALVFVNSTEGVGKGSFLEFLTKLFACGENTIVSFNSLDSFSSSFNAIQSKALWICLEEITARLGGLKSYNGLLKDKISSKVLLCEAKNKERVQIPFFANLLIFSNEFNVLSVSRNDRRLVFFTSDDSKANDKEYFVKLHQELKDLAILRAAFTYFATYDLENFNYRCIPHSKVKNRLVQCSEKNVTKFHRFLMQRFVEQNTYTVTAEDIYSHYRDYVQSFGVAKPSNRHNVLASMELYCDFIARAKDVYTFTEMDRTKFLKKIGT